MPALFVFLIKVNIALLVFCAGYYLVLRHLTFYTLNRIYLVTAILFASVYQKINLSGFFEQHQDIASPVQTIVYNLQAPAKEFMKPLAKPDYWQWAGIVFWLGAAILAIRLFIQFISLFSIYRKSKAGQIDGHKVRIIHGDSGPFSFWKNIFINPEMHEAADLTAILLHEQIHVSELHTLDILLGEISAIFYWFNPGIWLMKKAIRENIEFITDRKILQTGINAKQYQYSLVNVSFAAAPQGIVNHFNISTIKKRIIMMNAKRSSKVNLTRYAFLVPVVLTCLFAISQSKAELVKKNQVACKTIVNSIHTSVNKMAEIMGPTHVTQLKKPVVSLLLDTAKKNQKTVMTISSLATVDGDTSKKAGTSIDNNINDSTSYFINKRKVTKADFLNFNLAPNNIATITIEGKNSSTHSVYVVTKDDHDILLSPTVHGYFIPKPVQSINTSQRIKGDSILLAPKPITTTFKSKSASIANNNLTTNGTALRNNGDNTSEQPLNQSVTESIKTDPLSEVLIIVDGKKTTKKDLQTLLNAGVLETGLLNGPDDHAMIDKYGDKAKKGIFIGTTKKAKKK